LYFIEQKAKTNFSFAEMNTGLALVESLLGGYIVSVFLVTVKAWFSNFHLRGWGEFSWFI